MIGIAEIQGDTISINNLQRLTKEARVTGAIIIQIYRLPATNTCRVRGVHEQMESNLI